MRPEIERAVRLIQRKDPQSLEEALALLQNTVFSFSMSVCGHRPDAEDTMQEVLLQSVPKLSKFDNPRALLVWLYKVAKTRCLMSRRKSKFAPKEALSLEELMPGRRELESFFAGPQATPETALAGKENARRLREAIQKLPPEYRLILVLHDMEELSDSDIAEITGLRPVTIRVRLHRARLFVRKEMIKRGSPIPSGRSSKQLSLENAPPRDSRCKKLFAELSDYLDETLDDSLCAELEKHMDGCEPCQGFLASLEKSIERCRTAPKEAADPEVAAKVRQKVIAEYQKLMSRIPRGSASQP